MQQQLAAPLPAHDDKTDAVLLYSDTALTVEPSGKLRRVERRVYRILRREGQRYGTAQVLEAPQVRLTSIHGWAAPAGARPFEAKQDDAVRVGVPGAEWVTDLHMRVLRIPASVPGSVVGYEYETEETPHSLTVRWSFQETVPVREAHYTLELPSGWRYAATWLNCPEQSPVAGGNRAQWTVRDVAAFRIEPDMPPWQATAGQLWLALSPADGRGAGPQSWHDMGLWYLDLTRGRRDASAEMRQKVSELTAATPALLDKMRELAGYVQTDVRYVAIELGIGGFQPHSAASVFGNHYGDCKDKATLLSSMLKEIGVDSTYVIVNSRRGALSALTPPNLGFDHVVLAIVLPPSLQDPSLLAVASDARLGRLLIFDPTDQYTPLGSIAGGLQGGYGLLAAPEGGALMQLPQLAGDVSGVRRTAQMTLDEAGTLRGEVHEVLTGDRAARQRVSMASSRADPDHVKAVESHIGDSFATFRILKATVGNLPVNDRPVEWSYSLEVDHYAKAAGDLLVVRPRVFGSKSTSFLETHEKREHPIEFASALRDTDVFDIALPAGYQVDDLPPAVDIDDGFAAYHSKTEVRGHALRYSRTFEIRELSVPADKATQLRDFYRAVWADERAEAVLKRVSP